MAFALYKGKVYQCDGRFREFDHCSCGAATKITLKDGSFEKTLVNPECRLFTQAFLLAKYKEKWYSLPDVIVCDRGRICLEGEQQEGFELNYVDAGFPVYSKSVYFPQDITDVIVRITELTRENRFITKDYHIPVDRLECNNPDLILHLLEMILLPN